MHWGRPGEISVAGMLDVSRWESRAISPLRRRPYTQRTHWELRSVLGVLRLLIERDCASHWYLQSCPLSLQENSETKWKSIVNIQIRQNIFTETCLHNNSKQLTKHFASTRYQYWNYRWLTYHPWLDLASNSSFGILFPFQCLTLGSWPYIPFP